MCKEFVEKQNLLLLQEVLVFASKTAKKDLSLSSSPPLPLSLPLFLFILESVTMSPRQELESGSHDQRGLAKSSGQAGNSSAIRKAGFWSLSLGVPGNYLLLCYSEGLRRCLKFSIWPQALPPPSVFTLSPGSHCSFKYSSMQSLV